MCAPRNNGKGLKNVHFVGGNVGKEDSRQMQPLMHTVPQGFLLSNNVTSRTRIDRETRDLSLRPSAALIRLEKCWHVSTRKPRSLPM